MSTRSFVVYYFYPATYFGPDTCPQGLNPLPDVFFKRDLKTLGLPQAEVDRMFDADYNRQNGRPTTNWVGAVATRGNGKDNVYSHPTTVPDAHLRPAVGRFGYGFDLDGKGTDSATSYEDPDTHEKGVDNRLFHAIGCIPVYRGSPPPHPPLEPEYRWDSTRAAMGAWLILISGDLTHDGDVTVTLETSIDAVTTQDANGHVRSDMTYRVLDHPASRNVLRGRLRSGVVTTEPAPIRMRCDSYIQPLYEFMDARVRLKVKPDGTLEGVLGGYQPWYPVYWSHAKVGYIDERGFGVDTPALYYALRRDADAYPDPVTGNNTAISAAYMIEAVPAFVARATGAAAATAAKAAAAAATADPGATPAGATPPGATPAGATPAGATAAIGADRSLTCATLTGCARDAVQAIAKLFAGGEPSSPGAPVIARRLRPDQYRSVIADVFGPTIKIEGRFEPDVRDDGLFAVG
ncbi:MAG TPA: hypothetical protein VHV81_15955, partial [Steroidobacteraceae bacterium]|nr:hypothetical protein [Steroidobacteraceae bacterium]